MFEKIRFRHVFGILIAILIATFLAFFPWYFGPINLEAGINASTVTIFFVFILAFLMNNAIRKNYELRQQMNIELSRLRRIHHLAEKIGDTQKDKKFRNEIEKAIEAYLSYLQTNSLAKYKEARGAFRGITFTIYSFKPNNKRQSAFLKEFFATTRELALTRQNLTSLLERRISAYGWAVLAVIEAMVVGATLVTQGASLIDFIVSAATLATIFIITLMIFEIDDHSQLEMRELGRVYGKNKRGIEESERAK